MLFFTFTNKKLTLSFDEKLKIIKFLLFVYLSKKKIYNRKKLLLQFLIQISSNGIYKTDGLAEC